MTSRVAALRAPAVATVLTVCCPMQEVVEEEEEDEVESLFEMR